MCVTELWSTRETPRLQMRPPIAEDLDPYVEIHEDPEVLGSLGAIGPTTGRVGGWRMLALMLGHWHLRGYGQWTVVEKGTGDVVGRVGLWHPEGWPGVELGWLIRRSRWGRGYATEAAREALRFAFDVVEADHVISMIQPTNTRSIRLAEKLGESLEDRRLVNGQAMLVYGISRPS